MVVVISGRVTVCRKQLVSIGLSSLKASLILVSVGLGRRFDLAADYVAQPLKAVEYYAVRGGKWEHAEVMDFTTPENRGSVSIPADLKTIVTERKTKLKLTPEKTPRTT